MEKERKGGEERERRGEGGGKRERRGGEIEEEEADPFWFLFD